MDISVRIQKIASYVPNGKRVVDIGADHAYLLLHLAIEDVLEKGIAGELNRGPYRNACQQVKRYGYESKIDVRLGDGLTICQPDEIDVVVIAGMGGVLIRDILEQGVQRLHTVERLILQPNVAADIIRSWLQINGWRLIAEDLIEESGIIYDLLVAEPGYDDQLYQDPFLTQQELLKIGPLLWKDQHPLLVRRLKEEHEKRTRIFAQLAQSKGSQAIQKRDQLNQELKQWERMIRWASQEQH
ncbi:tRNA (adenine22-N1)-methyltransferase [Seinonella peptonophila]|uniref:tRNA (Adenine22-N1)-methyltransferase n=1 Tax=Seinonella peptonophila TaxID=112248 RepID=A0A1M4V639_9BACL|nr:class I SAM-dependent methyltransferase [Seinonella peptonophila]SHE64343.1 tRNA (adenine22-N1)-methyltransferase [Seinonella peptonophila]